MPDGQRTTDDQAARWPGDACFVAAQGIVAADLGDEAVILDPQAGIYFGLDELGARIWQVLQQPVTVAGICAVVTAEYMVGEAQCRDDLLVFLRELHGRGLIEVVNAAGR